MDRKGIHAHRVCHSSSSTKIKLKDIPVEIRDRRAVFGYIIDNELLVNWYSKKCGIQDFSEPEHYFDALSKRDLALIAADAAKCSILTVSRTLPSEEIIFAYFASYKPPCISTATLPTEGQLQKFKDCLSLDDDPQWRLLVASGTCRFFTSLQIA